MCGTRVKNMKKASSRELDDDLRPEYDLSKLKVGVRGKYAKKRDPTMPSEVLPGNLGKPYRERSERGKMRKQIIGNVLIVLPHGIVPMVIGHYIVDVAAFSMAPVLKKWVESGQEKKEDSEAGTVSNSGPTRVRPPG